ncbi:hypothetical protein LJC23_01855 [Desulfovibrio sp. OttesenSCG-928-I05]|nr:hypothetical protein [Desulfovibrio sp. OttesenSCG-928-I05]
MATYKTELFGHLVYSPELSYEDLLAREEEAKLLLQNVLMEHGAEFLNFEALGDTLRAQCVFSGGDEAFYQDICNAMSPVLRDGITGRLLFVDKDLEILHLYALADGKWQEAVMQLPQPGFLDLAALPVKVLDVAPSRAKAAQKPAQKPAGKPAGKK